MKFSKFTKRAKISGFTGLVAIVAGTTSLDAASVAIGNQMAGPTPFIILINCTINPASAFKTVQFTVASKPGSVVRPVSALYSADYLQMRGYFNPQNGRLVLPMFGLYDNYSNTVVLRFGFTDGSFQQQQVAVSTPAWTDPCNVYKNFTPIQARTASTDLSYDYILIKSRCSTQTPVIIDTDGAVRWVGTGATEAFSSAFFANGIYIASNPPSSSNTTGLTRIELDGTSTFLHDYTNWGVTSTNHHNIDPGKKGLILEVNTNGQVESMIMEVDAFGAVLGVWKLADIIRSAMIAGGDDPTQFVYPAPNDWFHNNAVTYRASDDSLIVSGREDFVICLDYKSGAIKWIFGDSNKKWFQFPSLRKYALVPQGSTLAPIGQHAVSITHDDNLLLFDDGFNSLFQMPPGISRTYSAARKYNIDKAKLTATEVWNFVAGQTIFSPICSSVYEDAPLNYLIDYAQIGSFTSQSNAELLGLTAAGNKVFDYRYVQPSACDTAWNAIPVHFENLAFTNVPLPKLSNLIDNFNGNTLDKWTSHQGTNYSVALTNQRLQVTDNVSSSDWGGISSNNLYDATNSVLSVNLQKPGNSTTSSAVFTWIKLQANRNNANAVEIGVNGGNLYAKKWVGGTVATFATASYNTNPSAMQWLRIRENLGTTYWEYASTYTGPWTTLASVPDPVMLSSVSVEMGVGAWPGTSGQMILDNVNTSQ